jgi:ribonuclease R
VALQKMAAESSFSERQAMEVEREVVDLYRAYFMRDRVGDVLDGVISGVTGFGLFVTIDDPFVEGLVRIDAISDDYYTFDERASRLVGRRSGQAFALGDSVQVEVQSVSVVRRKIDFALAGHVSRNRPRDFQRGDKRRRDGRSARRGEGPKGADKSSARPRDGFRRGKPGAGAGAPRTDRSKSGGRGNPPRGKPKKKGR